MRRTLPQRLGDLLPRLEQGIAPLLGFTLGAECVPIAALEASGSAVIHRGRRYV
ncbi:MAG: hypothetical protein JOZ98_07915 [Solirubrobacterales bacterium]|nr:hypothetical protein [Solirubrobacterales bacterium]